MFFIFQNFIKTSKIVRSHLYEHFTAFYNYHERVAFAGLMITQIKPTLNKQKKVKSHIYGCIERVNQCSETGSGSRVRIEISHPGWD